MNQTTAGSANGSHTSNVLALVKGLMTAVLLSVALFAMMAGIMLASQIPESFTSTITIVVSILSIVIGGFVASRGCESRGWLWGGLVGICYMLLLYIIGILITGFAFGTHTVVMLIVDFIAGAIGGIVANNMKPTRKRR